MERDLRIVHLMDVPEAAPAIARWFADEWAPWYGPDGPGDAESDLAACCDRDAIPICLVAMDRNGEVLGTGALKSESVGSDLGVGPWLSALLVDESHRGKGIGTALIAAIEGEARRLGLPFIYTSTDAAESILQRRGWQIYGTAKSLRGPVKIYRRQMCD